jgi:hypothetical protein
MPEKAPGNLWSAIGNEGIMSPDEPYLKEAMLAVVQGNPVPHPVTKP